VNATETTQGIRDKYGLARAEYGKRVHIVRSGHQSLLQLGTEGRGPFGLCHGFRAPADEDPTAEDFIESPCRNCLWHAAKVGLLDDWLRTVDDPAPQLESETELVTDGGTSGAGLSDRDRERIQAAAESESPDELLPEDQKTNSGTGSADTERHRITVDLPPELDRTVRQVVDEGHFMNTSDAVRAALRAAYTNYDAPVFDDDRCESDDDLVTDGGHDWDPSLDTDVERGGASTIATVDVRIDTRHLALVASVPYGTTERELHEALAELEAVLEREPNINLSPRKDRQQVRADGGASTAYDDPTADRQGGDS
jgi:hypothetical protein